MNAVRISVCVSTDAPHEADLFRTWLRANADAVQRLTVGGCGCCVWLYDIEARAGTPDPPQVIACVTDWTSSGGAMRGEVTSVAELIDDLG